MRIISQQFDWLRFGPIEPREKRADLEKRLGYLEIRYTNYFGKNYVDLSGDKLEIVRTVEPIDGLLAELKTFHWTRLDIAFDIEGVDMDTLDCPGSAIINDSDRQTIYSHKLGSRGDYPMFSRVYDAFEAGHDVDPGVVRAEVEFKLGMPDILKISPQFPWIAFHVAAVEISERFGLAIPLPFTEEFSPTKRIINHERELFYARFGRRIVSELVELGFDGFITFVMDCQKRKMEVAK